MPETQSIEHWAGDKCPPEVREFVETLVATTPEPTFDHATPLTEIMWHRARRDYVLGLLALVNSEEDPDIRTDGDTPRPLNPDI